MVKFLLHIHEFSDLDTSMKEEGCNYTENDDEVKAPPKRVVSSERHFDRQDGHKQKDESKKKLCDYLEVNIGTNEEPRLIKVGKTTPIEERNEIVKLLKEYRDVLAFSYDELKVYREDVIQHVIPLKEGTNPFRQKLRQLNPKLAPLVLLTASSTRGSTPCTMKICINRCEHVEDFLVVQGIFAPTHSFVSRITAPLRGFIM
jgi:hypothetical protein